MMLEVSGVDIWNYVHTHRIVIPTNIYGVMGAGLARQARERYQDLENIYKVYQKEKDYPTQPVILNGYETLILCPTKRKWQDPSPIELVEANLKILATYNNGPYVIPELGCGLGKLTWNDVAPLYQVLRNSPAEWIVLHPARKSYNKGLTYADSKRY